MPHKRLAVKKKVTASQIILLSSNLKKYCATKYLNSNPDLPELVRYLGQSLLASLNERCSNMEQDEIFVEATFLDPRFKNHGFTSKTCFDATKESIT